MAGHFGQYGTDWLHESHMVQPQFQTASMLRQRSTQNLTPNPHTHNTQATDASASRGAQSPALSSMDWTPTQPATIFPKPAAAFATNSTSGGLNYQPYLKLPAGNKASFSSHISTRNVTETRPFKYANARQTFDRPSSETLELLRANREQRNGKAQSIHPREAHANYMRLHVDRNPNRPRLSIDSTRPYCPTNLRPSIQHDPTAKPFTQIPATPVASLNHPQIRRLLNPQSPTAKYVHACTTRMGTPQLASAIPGGFQKTPNKRSFDEYATEKDTKPTHASQLPITGREDFVKPSPSETNAPMGIFRALHWVSEAASSWFSRFVQTNYPDAFVASKSQKRRKTMPGAFPESPAIVGDMLPVEQTKGFPNSAPAAHAQSPVLSQPPARPATPPPSIQSVRKDPWSSPVLRPPLSPAHQKAKEQLFIQRRSRLPKMQLNSSVVSRSYGLSEMRQSRQAHSIRAGWRQSTKLEDRAWPFVRRMPSSEELGLGFNLPSSIGASSAASASPTHGLSTRIAIKAPEEKLFVSSQMMTPLPPPGQYAESESRPTSSGSDASIIVSPSDAAKNAATTLESAPIPADVDLSFVEGELQRSMKSTCDKLAAEEERRVQQLEEKAREERKALEEREAKEKAEREAREAAAAAAEAARAAEREVALKAMTDQERWVLDRSSGLFGALPQAHATTLQDLAQKSDSYDIKGNFKSKDLRSMIGSNPSGTFDRPWLNDEAVWKATDMLCLRANEKAGFSKQVKARGRPAPFHAYTPMWYTSINSFGDASMKSWGRRANHLGENLFQTQAVFLPICDRSHWRLVVIFGQRRTIHYFDSLGGPPRQYINTAKRLMSVFMGEYWNESDWTVIQEQNSPRQGNGSDCGMFVIVNTANVLRGRAVLPSSYDSEPEVIDHARRWFASAIVNGGFTGDFDWEDEASPVMA